MFLYFSAGCTDDPTFEWVISADRILDCAGVAREIPVRCYHPLIRPKCCAACIAAGLVDDPWQHGKRSYIHQFICRDRYTGGGLGGC